MALKLRRGTDVERLTIIPQEGELIYTTDLKELYAGDGITVGGNRITGSVVESPAVLTRDLDLNSNNITGTGNININGTIFADVDGNIIGDVLGDVQGSIFSQGSTLLVDALDGIIPAENIRGEFTGNVVGDVTGSIFADSSSLLVDAVNGKLIGNVEGNVEGNIKGNVSGLNGDILVDASTNTMFGELQGDVKGTVFGDDSTILVDGVNSKLTGPVENTTILTEIVQIEQYGGGTSRVELKYTSDTDLIADTTSLGALTFHRVDPINGDGEVARISANTESVTLWHSNSQLYGVESNWVVFKDQYFGIGRWNPTATLDINGFAKLAILTAPPASPAPGMIAIADGATWDPSGANPTKQQTVVYLGSAWVQIAIEA